MRIVSLLPSTTEILFAIGAGDDVVGRDLRVRLPRRGPHAHDRVDLGDARGPGAAEIDDFVAAAMRRGEDLYHLDEGALAGLDADLVVTQDLCAVCAVDVSVVDDALAHLGCTAEVLTIDPHTLAEVLESILVLGRATGREPAAAALVADQRARIDAVARRRRAPVPRPRVMLLEWTDPPFAPGHWIPEMVSSPAASRVLGRAGEKSRRVTWDEVHAADPEVVVVAPCGYDLAGAEALADELVASAVLPAASPCTPSTPTPPGPAPAPASSTASRTSRLSSTVELGNMARSVGEMRRYRDHLPTQRGDPAQLN